MLQTRYGPNSIYSECDAGGPRLRHAVLPDQAVRNWTGGLAARTVTDSWTYQRTIIQSRLLILRPIGLLVRASTAAHKVVGLGPKAHYRHRWQEAGCGGKYSQIDCEPNYVAGATRCPSWAVRAKVTSHLHRLSGQHARVIGVIAVPDPRRCARCVLYSR